MPTTNQVLRVPLTEKGTVQINAKANRVGCAPGQLVRQGIDCIVDLAVKSPGRAFAHIREPSPLCRESWPDSEEKSSSEAKECSVAVTLRPARMAALIEAARATGAAAEEEAGGLPLQQNNVPWQDILGQDVGLGAERPALMTRLVQGAARWAAASLQIADIRTGNPSSWQEGQLFEKPSDEERGGRRVPMYITKEAKQEIVNRASQFGWRGASKLARLAICDVIGHIERRPREALRYVREERKYYQPPNRGKEYHYAYQVAVGLETRRLIKYAPLVLQHVSEGNSPEENSPEEDAPEGNAPEGDTSEGDTSERNVSKRGSSKAVPRRKLTQKRVLQAAGRYAIESENIDFPPLGPGASG
jgi:hypothetical protein